MRVWQQLDVCGFRDGPVGLGGRYSDHSELKLYDGEITEVEMVKAKCVVQTNIKCRRRKHPGRGPVERPTEHPTMTRASWAHC